MRLESKTVGRTQIANNAMRPVANAVAAASIISIILGPLILPSEILVPLAAIFTLALLLLHTPISHRDLVVPLLGYSFIAVLCARGFADSPTQDVLRDFAHLAKIPIFLLLGALCYRAFRSKKTFLGVFLFSSVLLAIPTLATQFAHLHLIESSIYEYKKAIIIPSLALPLSVGVLLAGYYRPAYRKPLSLAVLLLALGLTLSRAYYIITILSALALTGLLYKIRLSAIITIISLATVIYFFVEDTPPELRSGPDATIAGKVAFSLEEFWPRNYEQARAIRSHWRGYENWIVLQLWEESNWTKRIFGWGGGKQIELQMRVTLAGISQNSVSRVHNGFATILVKTGLLGLFAYVSIIAYFYMRGLRLTEYEQSEAKQSGLFLVALALTATAGSLVIMLPFNAVDSGPFWLIMGYALGASGKYGKVSRYSTRSHV